ncbi:hypothetical protein [Desulfobacula sp.]|jgi:hypothetical protein
MIEYDDGATPLNYDELKGLLPTHITTRGELDFLEIGVCQASCRLN